MKLLFMPAKSEVDVSLVIKELLQSEYKDLKFGLVSAVQYAYRLKEIKALLKTAIIAGTITGCNVSNAEKIKNKVDAFLFIGTGRFHPLYLACKTGKRVIITNPETALIDEIRENEVKALESKRRTALIKFLNAEKIGIIVSIKKGQFNLDDAERLRKKLKHNGKEAFIFLCDNIEHKELENFPDIKAWVNTACPRITDYFCILNIGQAFKLLNEDSQQRNC